MLETTKYDIELTLTRPFLATNPADPLIQQTHILDKSRKLIMEKSKVNTEINKYLEALPPTKERGEAEVNLLIDKLESILGTELSPEDRAKIAAGDLESFKETVKELDTRGTTIFFWNKELDRPMIGDHMIYGFMKAAAEAIGRTVERKKSMLFHSISYTQSIINQHVRCDQEFLTFDKDIERLPDGTPKYLQRSLRAQTAQGPRVSLVKSEVVPAGAKLRFTLKVLNDSPLDEQAIHRLFSYGEMTGLGQWRNAGYGTFHAEIVRQKSKR